MITTLAVFLIATIIGTWLYSMYLSWKLDSGMVLRPIHERDITTRQEHLTRVTRKYWYWTQLKIGVWSSWVGEKITRLFFKLFPSAVPAFTKKDPLTGLEQGPASYFLKQISESKPETPVLRNRKKKV